MSDMRLLPFTPAASQCAKVCSVLSHSLRGRACYLLPWRVFGTTEVPLDARAAQASPNGSHNSRPPPPPRATTFDRRQLKCPAVRLLTDEDRYASAAADRFCQHASMPALRRLMLRRVTDLEYDSAGKSASARTECSQSD